MGHSTRGCGYAAVTLGHLICAYSNHLQYDHTIIHDITCPQDQGISFEEMKLFSQLVEEIADVEMALSMYLAAGASITAGMAVRT